MRKILCIYVLTAYALFGWASNDRASLECVYRLTFLIDTVNSRSVDAMMILRLGKSQSLFYSEAKFESDSLSSNVESASELRAIRDSIRSRYGRMTATYYVMKDFNRGQLDFMDNVMQTYKYTESLPSFDWQYTDEKKTIGEHECQKALCQYGGRQYELWFAPDIPISDGPWKFHGLPGLILEAYDTQHHYEFTFLGMRECAGEIAIPQEEYVKTSKKDYLHVKQLSIDNPNAFLEGIAASMGIKGDKVPKRHFYKTMELVELIDKNK